MRGHAYDALVGLAGCDKSLPGMMMAMCRLNVRRSSLRRSILPGDLQGQPRDRARMCRRGGGRPLGSARPVTTTFDELEQVACPSAGACGAQFTANTMATVSEAIGLAFPIRPVRRRPMSCAIASAMTAGEQVMELVRQNIRPRDIVTRRRSRMRRWSWRLGWSPPMRHSICPRLRMNAASPSISSMSPTIFRRTPYIADLRTGRPIRRQGFVRGRGDPAL